MTVADGYTWAARATNYRGTWMRSRLEASVAGALDAAGIPWSFEPHALADGEQQWLPDFQLGTANGTRVYIEVRPTLDLLRRDLARYHRIATACDPDALVLGLGHVEGDPLVAVMADGTTMRLTPSRPQGIAGGAGTPRYSPASTPAPRMELLPVPAPLRRRASERARLDKITRDLDVFRTTDGRGFARMDGLALPLESGYRYEPTRLAEAIANLYAEAYGRPPSSDKLDEHMAALTEATTVVEDVCHGVARLDHDRWVLDLGTDHPTGRVVTITSTGWRLSHHSPLPLWRDGITALPLPVGGGHVDELFDVINVHEDDFDTFVDLLVAQLLPGRPAPAVSEEGRDLHGQVHGRNGRGPIYVDPLSELCGLVRATRHRLFTRGDADDVVRFVELPGRTSGDAAVRAVRTIDASAGRLLGALLDRAVAILAGPRELPAAAPVGAATPLPACDVVQRVALPAPLDPVDVVQLILDTFPGTTEVDDDVTPDDAITVDLTDEAGWVRMEAAYTERDAVAAGPHHWDGCCEECGHDGSVDPLATRDVGPILCTRCAGMDYEAIRRHRAKCRTLHHPPNTTTDTKGNHHAP